MKRLRNLRGGMASLGLVVIFLVPADASAQNTSVIKATPGDLAAIGVTATGDGVDVAILESDGGFDLVNPAFDGYTGGLSNTDFTGNGLTPSYHAAGVASVIVASGSGLTGVAPGVDDFEMGSVNSAEAIAQAITSLDAGVDVVNLSLGIGSVTPDGMSQLTQFLDWWANTQDVVIVKSAGNSGSGGVGNAGSTTITVPGDGYNMITVGATNANNSAVASFSSEGRTTDLRNKPDIVAPGQQVTMAREFYRDDDGINGDFLDDDGDGQIGLNQNQFREIHIGGVIFQDNAGNPVNSLSILDSDNSGTVFGDFIKDGNPGANWTDVNGNNSLDSGDIVHSNLAFDGGDDPDIDTIQQQGTSFAAPHAAGAAALLRDFARKSATHDDDHRVIKAIMLNGANHSSVTDKNGGAWLPSLPGIDSLDDELGSGMLDVKRSFLNFKPDETADPAMTDPVAWDFNEIDGNATIDYVITEELLSGSVLTATLVWDRLLSRTVDGDSFLLDDPFTIEQNADLDLTLLKDGVALTSLDVDAMMRAPFSHSPVDPTEHIHFTLPGNGNYTLRVSNAGADDNVFFGLALMSRAVPEPSSAVLLLLSLAGALGWRRR